MQHISSIILLSEECVLCQVQVQWPKKHNMNEDVLSAPSSQTSFTVELNKL